LDGGANFQDPSSGPNGLSHLVTGLNPGEQITIVVRALGVVSCQNSLLSDAVTAFVPNKIFFVPNVFTPNGDGKNDLLMVFSHSISQIDFKIFNQWGVQVFESTKQGNGWDGKYKGVAQPVGVYVYILKLVLTDGTVLHKKGSVSLLR
jgi:gliding motility-associated-like protein